MRKNLNDITARHEVVLQMYGEAKEREEELLQDIEVVKSSYRHQLDARK